MLVRQVQVKKRLPQKEFVRLQIQLWCTLSGIVLTETTLDSLVVLAMLGDVELAVLCKLLAKTESSWYLSQLKEGRDDIDIKHKFIFSSDQSARNALTKLATEGLVTKFDKHYVRINQELEVLIEEGTLLNLQLLCYEAH